MSISAIPSSTFSQSPLTAPNRLYKQDFAQLGQDLISGNLSGAQQDYSSLRQDLQDGAGRAISLFLHHHHLGGLGQRTDQNPLQQLLTQLGQDLSSGNLSAAQQAYSKLQAQSPASSINFPHNTEPPARASSAGFV